MKIYYYYTIKQRSQYCKITIFCSWDWFHKQNLEMSRFGLYTFKNAYFFESLSEVDWIFVYVKEHNCRSDDNYSLKTINLISALQEIGHF